jgi:beta-glucanase (GH16 family)
VTAVDRDGNAVDQTSRVLNTADNGFALNRQPYLSGIITSYNSFRFKYGRVEARARMPARKGLWSAVWLLNAYYKQDPPEDPEIDIIEAIGDQTTTANHA